MYNKYSNTKTAVFDGDKAITFHSRKEARRYQELKYLVVAKKIKNLELQKKFLLQPSFKNSNNELIREINYICDFFYFDEEKQKEIVEDVKGIKTDVYLIKKKLFLFKHPQYIFLET